MGLKEARWIDIHHNDDAALADSGLQLRVTWRLFRSFVEERRHIDRGAVQQRRGRRLTPAEHTLLHVVGPHELEDGNRLGAGIDDPVLGDASLGVVAALDDKIARRIVRADDFGHEVGAEPVTVLATRIEPVA